MNVPLRVDAVKKGGKEYLDIWYGDNINKCILSPVKPYFYTDKRLSFSNAITESVDAISLSKFKKKTFYKHSFKTRDELVDQRNEKTFEDNIPFVLRNRIDNPNLFSQYSQKDLRFLFLDIEQSFKINGIFPTYDDYLTSIAWSTNDRKMRCRYLSKGKDRDKDLLKAFIKSYQDIDPHVIVVYNKSYDIPTLLYRCKRNGINTNVFSKTKEKPYIGGKENYKIDGVVIYDVAKSTAEDQALSGEVENRGLKEVSNYYGFNEIRKPLTPEEMEKYEGTRTLANYNIDDVRRLCFLFDIYWINIEYDANALKIPLNFSVEMNTTNRGIIMIGDSYRKLGIIADGSNAHRFPEIFGKSKKKPYYQGAIVGVFHKGKMLSKGTPLKKFSKPTYKADYSSMYPTTMAEFNFSSDTTTVVEYLPYKDQFEMKEFDDHFMYVIPDNRVGSRVVLKVLKKEGFQAKHVRQLLEERAKYKKRYKKTGNPIDKAKSVNRKVGANAGIYGNQGSAKHPFGCVPTAIGTTGVDREAIKLLMYDVLQALYGIETLIETDTDGVYFTCEKDEFDRELILNKFDEVLRKKFGKEFKLSIDFDEYKASYFYMAKNYILLTQKDKIILHGQVMKASNKNLLSKNLINELAKAKLYEEPINDIKEKYLTLDFPLRWFAMNKTLRMPFNRYKYPDRSISSRLAKDAEYALGIPKEQGNIYHYIASRGGKYKLYQLARIEDIDREYYLNQVKDILEIFDSNILEESLESWL